MSAVLRVRAWPGLEVHVVNVGSKNVDLGIGQDLGGLEKVRDTVHEVH